MRRKDREISDKEGLLAILQSCVVCRLGFAAAGRAYVVPLNFGYAWEENEPLRLYFHCAREGLKLDMLARNDLVCFEMDGEHKLLPGTEACEYSFAYASIIGWGKVSRLTQAEEKRNALQKIMERQAGPGDYRFREASIEGVTILCLEAEELTGKRHSG